MDNESIHINNNQNHIYRVKDAKEKTNQKIIGFYLCDTCYKRNFESKTFNTKIYDTIIRIIIGSNNTCYICKDLFKEKINCILNEILNHNVLRENNKIFSIDIGTTLPVDIYDSEDYIRSLFKIKGRINIKNQINDIIRESLTKRGFMISFSKPDVKIETKINEDLKFSISIHTKELILVARYKKFKRGLHQKKTLTENNHFELENKSIEEHLIEYISNCTSSNKIKIQWTGGEDSKSLVQGNGRPVIIKVFNPQKANTINNLLIKDMLEISFEEKSDKFLKVYENYKIKVLIHIKISNDFEQNEDLKHLLKKLIGNVKFKGRYKINEKQIYDLNYSIHTNNNLILQLICDNGIPIKRLVEGKEFIYPNISDIIGTHCECIFFDIEEFLPKDQ